MVAAVFSTGSGKVPATERISRARFRRASDIDPGVLLTVVMAQQAPQVVDVDDRFGGTTGQRGSFDIPGELTQGSRSFSQKGRDLFPVFRGQRH